MSSSSVVPCREVFDENSQPSAEEISDYAQQLGIDLEHESHLLPLARDGLMQALPPPWKAYYDEKIQQHYYYNEETKRTQWEHPLDRVYRELVRRSRDASVQDDTYVSVQELLTSEENTRHLSRVETKVESDAEALSTDEESDASGAAAPRPVAPLGRPPLAPLSKTLEKKLMDTRISPLRRSVDSSFKAGTSREKEVRVLERPKFFKQQSEIIDLKLFNHVLHSPEEESFNLFGKGERVLQMGLPLTGKGSMFLKAKKADLPSPDTDKSLPLESMTKSDPPKGILREKIADAYHRKVESLSLSKPRQTTSFEEDRKSVRFQLEHTTVEPALSPGSNSSSDHNDNQSSIISATPTNLTYPPPTSNLSSNSTTNIPVSSIHAISSIAASVPLRSSNMPIVLAPIVARPPLPPRPQNSLEQVLSPKESTKSVSASDRESLESESRFASPRRRVVRPPAADYIKPDLFQKSFHKICDLVRPGDIDLGRPEGEPVGLLGEPSIEKEARPRSPMIPQVNKISINLMESIESETSIDSPDREFANLDLNDMDDSKDIVPDKTNENKDKVSPKESQEKENSEINSQTHSSSQIKSPNLVEIPQINVPKFDFHVKPQLRSSESEDSKKTTPRDESRNSSRSESLDHKNVEPRVLSPTIKISPNPSIASDIRSPKFDAIERPPWSTFKPGLNKAVVSPQMKTSDSNTNLNKGLSSPRLDGVIISQGKSVVRGTDNVVVMYQFEKSQEGNSLSKPLKSPADIVERNKLDERRRLDIVLQKELEEIRVESAIRERKSRAELLEEMRENEERFREEKRLRLMEQAERHRSELEEALKEGEQKHQQLLREAEAEREERRRGEVERAEGELQQATRQLRDEGARTLLELRRELELDNERALAELHSQLQTSLQQEKARLVETHRANVDRLRQEQDARLVELRHDYRAEVERLRAQHSCHLEEVRRRAARREPALDHKYAALKEKYCRLKHDVKSSIERRNKRRELSLATGSETDKSTSHRASQERDRCKEQSARAAGAPRDDNSAGDPRANNNPPCVISPESSNTDGRRRTTVVFKEPPRRPRDKLRDAQNTASIVTTDFQDSSDATTADEKPRETVNGHGRRRCFTRLKSASTSRLNYSPKRGEGWSSPLEALRQQLRQLDDLDDQFPDLGSQPPYSLRYPFGEFDGIAAADLAELEFVRHRALIEREGMRRCRSALRRRRRLLQHQTDSESRDTTELEVALHRARALLGEREIRLRHIERALRALPGAAPPPDAQDSWSGSESAGGGRRALRRDAGDAWRDAGDVWRDKCDTWRGKGLSPESSSCPAGPGSPRAAASLPPYEPPRRQDSDSVAERARGLRAWLKTAP